MAKKLYEVDLTIEGESQDIYFTSMTPQELKQAHDLLGRTSRSYTITAVTDSPGYHSFTDIMRDWERRFEIGE